MEDEMLRKVEQPLVREKGSKASWDLFKVVPSSHNPVTYAFREPASPGFSSPDDGPLNHRPAETPFRA
ncbi:hypothetical protein CDAR_263961 [Caerostris darwini]|uniref:Uncharacterized protein n=1 Tax=Caerostris darwini TaxID=1538125 RepID=A0AAV4TUR7_9ARAC|nr:hypothetical protein CDAR_263961 [Caerostris darwini]